MLIFELQIYVLYPEHKEDQTTKYFDLDQKHSR